MIDFTNAMIRLDKNDSLNLPEIENSRKSASIFAKSARNSGYFEFIFDSVQVNLMFERYYCL